MLSARLTALWKLIKAGNKVTLRDVDLDLLSEHFDALDTNEATLYFHRLATLPHPEDSRSFVAFLSNNF